MLCNPRASLKDKVISQVTSELTDAGFFMNRVDRLVTGTVESRKWEAAPGYWLSVIGYCSVGGTVLLHRYWVEERRPRRPQCS